jgi:segregation and condensation protein B
MLFIGGPPLTATKACSAIRGLTAERFREGIDELARLYRRQNRPYTVQSRDDGFFLAVKPQFRSVREKLYGGPRQARLSSPALDVLSLIAYRQPLSKADVDSLRGVDSAGVIRQLVRLGLIAVTQRADADHKAVGYGTTPRFLELFGLGSLDELPILGDHRTT